MSIVESPAAREGQRESQRTCLRRSEQTCASLAVPEGEEGAVGGLRLSSPSQRLAPPSSLVALGPPPLAPAAALPGTRRAVARPTPHQGPAPPPTMLRVSRQRIASSRRALEATRALSTTQPRRADITLEIDGVPVTVPQGTALIQACEKAGASPFRLPEPTVGDRLQSRHHSLACASGEFLGLLLGYQGRVAAQVAVRGAVGWGRRQSPPSGRGSAAWSFRHACSRSARTPASSPLSVDAAAPPSESRTPVASQQILSSSSSDSR